jgi:UDP-N-acetylmuramoyl-L-alanyl-D-glutamate--2,6-diaminopimelate ligase
MRLEELGAGCLDVPVALRGVEVAGLACDSREVTPGCLFVAVAGEKTDGHLYVAQAAAAGAVAVVGERRSAAAGGPRLEVPYLHVPDSRRALASLGANFYGSPQSQVVLAGVTGTKGKTTTAWVLDAILRKALRTTALIGTVHNRVGARDYPSRNTTPSCLELLRYLRELRDQGGSHAVMEVSSHGIAQGRTNGLVFRCGVLTNIQPEHLDYHGTFESYLDVKARFFADLPADGFAVLPREDPASDTVADRTRARVAWYGTDSQDGVEYLQMGPEGMSCHWKGVPMRTRLWGGHNLLNVIAAATAAECLGFSREEIAAGVAAAVAPPGRLEEVAHSGPFHVFVDYAHTDGALETVLRTLRSVVRGRVITVFGCGGDRDREKRPRMGRVAEKLSDHVVLTSDNPRTEDPERIFADIMRGFERPEDIVLEPDRRAAIGLGIRMARENDVVLVAGKGHETYQELEEGRIDFDDREVARGFLEERSHGATASGARAVPWNLLI